MFVLCLCVLEGSNASADAIDDVKSRVASLVPQPQEISIGAQTVPLPRHISVFSALSNVPSSVKDRLRRILLPLGRTFDFISNPQTAFLQLIEDSKLPEEGYTLKIERSGIEVRFRGESGAFYSLVTLEQILPDREIAGANVELPFVSIQDAPEFSWRGLMVDSSRHFQTVDQIFQILEAMAIHKLNRFHWHLTDDQGWRLEIPSWPRLTSVGAWRTESNGQRYGGFYTAADVRSVVEYAALRSIVVVPEIEFPGHSAAALAAYPELSADGKLRVVPSEWAVIDGVLSIGRPQVRAFVQDVQKTLADLFPGPYVHWGGDEVYREPWKTDSKSVAWFKEQGWNDAFLYLPLMWSRLAQSTLEHGKIPIGWDEVVLHAPPAKTLIQAWDDPARAIRALKQGYSVINSWKLYTYLDYPEWDWDVDRQDWMTVNSTFHSLDDSDWVYWGRGAILSKEEKKRMIGIEACLWTERVRFGNWPRKLFPRLSVLSEVAWKGENVQRSLKTRLKTHVERLERLGWSVFLQP